MESIRNAGPGLKPIIAYGNNILRKEGLDVEHSGETLNFLIDSLWKTLDYSGGVGLAAPQIDDNHRVFVVNSKIMYNECDAEEKKVLFSGDQGIEEVFINAEIVEVSDEVWKEQEGCLSIPGINELVERPWDIVVEYQDANMVLIRKQFSGYTAKVIQHELDHTNGVLFIDHLSALSKRLMQNKLKKVIEGRMEANYPIKYIK